MYQNRCFQSSVKLPLLVISRLIAIVTPNIGAGLAAVRTTPDKKIIRKIITTEGDNCSIKLWQLSKLCLTTVRTTPDRKDN